MYNNKNKNNSYNSLYIKTFKHNLPDKPKTFLS